MIRRSINVKLSIGLLIIVGLYLASVTDTWWLTHDPYYMEMYRTSMNDKGSIDYTPPAYPFGSENLLSTDMLGRDIFARLVSGAKVTFTIVLILTLIKMILAVPLGLLAGSNSNLLSKFTEVNSFVFSGFPTLLATIFIFSMPLFQGMTFWSKIIWMVVVIALLDWSRIAITIKGRTEQIMKEPYIEGAKVLGRSRVGILYFHVWKNIRSDVVILFVFECARSLMLLGSMALFGVYFLDTLIIKNDPLPPTRASLTPEWGTILGESRYHIMTNPLVTFVIAAIIVIAIVALNLIGEGLKDKYALPRPKRRTIVIDFPSVIKQRTAIIALLLLVIVTSFVYTYFLNPDEPALATSHSIGTKLKQIGNRYIGTPEAKQAAEVIADEWENIASMSEELHVHEKRYAIKIKYQDIATITATNGNDEVVLQKDLDSYQFANISLESGEVTATPVFVSDNDTYDRVMENISSGNYDGKILVLPIKDENRSYIDNINIIFAEILNKSDVKGIVFFDYANITTRDTRHDFIADLRDVPEENIRYFPVFAIKNENIDLLKQSQRITLKIQLPGVDSSIVHTHLGQIDDTKRNIVFYSYYDTESIAHLSKEKKKQYLDNSAMSMDMLTAIMKQLTANEDNRFNYYFAAIDGTKGKYVGFRQWLSQNQHLMNDKTIVIQVQYEDVPPELKDAGTTLATMNNNIYTQAERNAIERSISEAAWKNRLIPFVGKGAINFPASVNAPAKHVNLISNDDHFLSFVDAFLTNLEKEYLKYYDSIEMKKIEQDRLFEEMAKRGTAIKNELNTILTKALDNKELGTFLSLQNENNELFYKEQQRWFEEVMFKIDSWAKVNAEVIWVSLTEEEKYEAKLRVSFIDSNTSEVALSHEVVYKLISTEEGYKFDDMSFEEMRKNNIHILYMLKDKYSAEEILMQIEATLKLLNEHFGWTPENPMVFKLYPDDSSVWATVPKFPSMIPTEKVEDEGLLKEEVTISIDGEVITVDKDDAATNGWSEQEEAIKIPSFGKYNRITHEISKRMISEMSNGNLSYSLSEGLAHVLLNNIVKKQSGELVFSNELADKRALEHFKVTYPLLNWESFMKKTYKVEEYKQESEVFAHYLMIQGTGKLLNFFEILSNEPYVDTRSVHKNNITSERTMKALEQVYGPLDKLYKDIHNFYNSRW